MEGPARCQPAGGGRSRDGRGLSRFHGEDVLGKGNVLRAAKIGTVPRERLPAGECLPTPEVMPPIVEEREP